MGGLNLQEIDQEQASNLLRFYISTGNNCFLFGKSGIGKTEIAIQAIKKSGYKPIYVNLSVLERPDLAGYPNMLSNEDALTFKSPHFLPSLKDGYEPQYVILFDEIDKASHDVTAPLLEVTQFKTINGKRLDIAACVFTGNLLDERTFSNEISSALLGRAAKYKLAFSFEKWLEWAKNNHIHDLIISFLQSEQSSAFNEYENSYAAPSPRSWCLASKAFVNAIEQGFNDTDIIIDIISGFVGYETGFRFRAWYENYRKLEPIIHGIINEFEIVDESFDFNNLKPTELIVFVTYLCFYAKLQTIQHIKTKNKYKYIDNMSMFFNETKIPEEIVLMALYNSFSFELIAKNKLFESKLFFDWVTKLNKFKVIKNEKSRFRSV